MGWPRRSGLHHVAFHPSHARCGRALRDEDRGRRRAARQPDRRWHRSELQAFGRTRGVPALLASRAGGGSVYREKRDRRRERREQRRDDSLSVSRRASRHRTQSLALGLASVPRCPGPERQPSRVAIPYRHRDRVVLLDIESIGDTMLRTNRIRSATRAGAAARRAACGAAPFTTRRATHLAARLAAFGLLLAALTSFPGCGDDDGESPPPKGLEIDVSALPPLDAGKGHYEAWIGFPAQPK